jgi:putative nucleotidyltransferase with HDIG domain
MPEYSPLPNGVQDICLVFRASPRLVAHLILVHDLAGKLLQDIARLWPDVDCNREHVLFGAATHDIGKAVYPEELVAPGHKHERKGTELLQQYGVPNSLARFAYTHGNWKDEPTMEDLLVALADNLWKGKRLPELEDRFVEAVAQRTGKERWEILVEFDQLCDSLASDADTRLAWQASFPVAG